MGEVKTASRSKQCDLRDHTPADCSASAQGSPQGPWQGTQVTECHREWRRSTPPWPANGFLVLYSKRDCGQTGEGTVREHAGNGVPISCSSGKPGRRWDVFCKLLSAAGGNTGSVVSPLPAFACAAGLN